MRFFSILTALLLLGGSISEARRVSGRVTCGKEKLEHVIVTDGNNFTRTDKKGRFTFDIVDDAEFVYIVTPSGYAADWSSGVPAFHQRAEGKNKFVFDLIRTSEVKDYTLIAVADPQTRNRAHFSQFAAEPMEDLCRTAKTKDHPFVGLILGDICWDSLEMLELYKKEIVRAGMPFYPVVGNHDHEKEAKGDKNATAVYRREMGPENYAFCIGDDVVIVLDNIIYDTEKQYQNGYASHVLSWVEGLMQLLPEDAYIYIAQHAPVSVWDKGIKAVNAEQLISLMDGHDFCFLSGHTHINNYLIHGEGAVEHNIAAICGSWWDTVTCTDGTPRGYKVFTRKDGRLSWYYKSVDHPKDYQVQIFRKGESRTYPDCILVNVWDWDPEWKVNWYEDGIFKGKAEQMLAFSPQYEKEIKEIFDSKGEKTPKFKKPRKNTHYFALKPAAETAKVKVCIESRFGEVWEYEIDCK